MRIRHRGGLIGYFVRHGTAANLLMLAMLMSGAWGLATMRTQFFPDVPTTVASVTVAWPGATAEDVDRQIVTLAEPALRAAEGVRSTMAVSYGGRARIRVRFEAGTDRADGLDALRAALATLPLPETAEDPVIDWSQPNDRVVNLVLHGPIDREVLETLAADLRDALFAAGVTRLAIEGQVAPVFQVIVDPDALLRHDLGLEDVAAAVREAGRRQPLGGVTGGGPRVAAGQDRRDLDALGDIVVRRDEDGAELGLRDLAVLALRDGPLAGSLTVAGAPALRLVVQRGAGEDAMALMRTVDATVAAFAPRLPAGVRVDEMQARMRAIGAQLGLLLRSGAAGLGLVMALLVLFLPGRTAFWVAAGMPVALAGSLGLMAFAGFSLDMMTLFALILCLGIVVDDAIVVGEHADTLARHGASPAAAAEGGARRMIMPVLASTLTTVIGFLALLTVGGWFGAVMAVIPFVVTVALAASLIECFVVLPSHMRHALAAPRRSWMNTPSRLLMPLLDLFCSAVCRPLVARAVRHRIAVAMAATGLLAGSVTMVLDGRLPWRFFDAPEAGLVAVNFTMMEGADLADTRAMLAELERAVAAVDADLAARHGATAVRFALGQIGRPLGGASEDSAGRAPDEIGALLIELTDPGSRPFTQNDVVRALDAAIRPHPRLETLRLRGERRGGGEEALAVVLSGETPQSLAEAAIELKAALETVDGIVGLEDSLGVAAETLRIDLTPPGEALGLTPAALATQLRARLSGIEAFEFAHHAGIASVRVLLPPDARRRGDLDRTFVRAPGGWVPLSAVATVVPVPGLRAIRRENGAVVVTVTGDIADDDPERAAAILAVLEGRLLPDIAAAHGVRYRLSGLREQEQRFLGEAAVGIGLCLAGIYGVLAWLFASWIRPVTVMLVIPFGAIGALWGHVWMGLPLSIFSVVGMIAMAGIVVNGAIVLAAETGRLARLRPLSAAIVDASVARFRPVFLTTATTIAGLVPILLDRSSQVQFIRPTAITLVFGVGSGMVLILLVTPALMALQGDVERALAALRRAPRLLRRWRRRAAGEGGLP